MVAQVKLQLVGSVDHLRIVWQTGETLLDSVPFDEDPEGTRYNVLLALQEMITNVLRHGYELNEQHPIEVYFAATTQGVQLEIRDRGPQFNPLEHDTTSIDVLQAMPDEMGGYGIYIAKMVMDDVIYRREGEWNVLQMRKAVAATSAAGTAASQQGRA